MIQTQKPLSTWQAWWGLIKCHPGLYLLTSTLRISIFTATLQATGLIMRSFFNALTGNTPLNWGPNTWAALLVAVAAVRGGLVLADMITFLTWTFSSGAVMRKNMFERILERPGARALPGSTGDAISRFREDADEVANFPAAALFPVARGLFTAVALIVMLQINVRVTLLAFLPLVAVVVLANVASNRIQVYRTANRGVSGQVAGFIGELFESVQAVQVAGAEETMLSHFQELNETRRKSAIKDRLFNEILFSVIGNISSLGTGVILLVAGQALQDGTFTVGDFSLFVFYLGLVGEFTFDIGWIAARFKHTGVALQRMNRLLQGALPERLVQKTAVYLRGPLPDIPFVPKTAECHLNMLEVKGLSYYYPTADDGQQITDDGQPSVNGHQPSVVVTQFKGIENINLTLRRGTFTVVTGRVGSGKTTLVRAVLGLLPRDSGQIYWNGELVAEPDKFFVPPRAAYTSQIPALFSESLRDNILLGLPEGQVDLPGAVYSAVLEQDLVQLPDGLDTMIGSRGVKLSGGQKQRTAVARMVVRQPELWVLDDVSSALDVETERLLWERVQRINDGQQTMSDELSVTRSPIHPFTLLVVSHRRPALRRADHIVVMKNGRIEDEGTLDELLERCQEMQHLWQGDIGNPPNHKGKDSPDGNNEE